MAVHGVSIARLRVHNSGEELLELVLEPHGSDHWLEPGETVMVWTFVPGGDPSRCGTRWPAPACGVKPFEVDRDAGRVTVYANGDGSYVADLNGNELETGHRRRARQLECTGRVHGAGPAENAARMHEA